MTRRAREPEDQLEFQNWVRDALFEIHNAMGTLRERIESLEERLDRRIDGIEKTIDHVENDLGRRLGNVEDDMRRLR